MSRGTVVARRYAKALFQIVRDQGLVAETETQLKLIADVLEGNAEIRAFLVAPNITMAQKQQALREAFGDKVSPVVMNMVNLLIERGRESHLSAVLDAYLQIAGEALGRIDAQVMTPTPLGEDEQAKLAAKFSEWLGKEVRITNVVKPELLGGVTVRIGDTLYDGSLRGKLDRLEKMLQTTAV